MTQGSNFRIIRPFPFDAADFFGGDLALFANNLRKMLGELAKPSPDWEKLESLSAGRYEMSGKAAREGRSLLQAVVERACSETVDSNLLLSVLRNLVSRGGDINKPITEGGESPMHLAVRTGNHEVVRIFLEAGSSPAATSISGESALHIAVSEGRDDICRILLDAGADAGAENSDGDAPIHIAVAGKNRKTIIRTLLKHGAKAYHRNGKGLTPIRVAEKSGNHQYIPLLEEALKSIRRARDNKWTCPACGAAMERPDVARINWYNTIGMWEHLRFTCGSCGKATPPTYLDGELS